MPATSKLSTAVAEMVRSVGRAKRNVACAQVMDASKPDVGPLNVARQ